MSKLAVAIAWNQCHYQALQGFHPLYGGLLEAAPAGVTLNAWDNVALHQQLESSVALRQWFLTGLEEPLGALPQEAFSAEARQLTRLLPGDIELFHSVPFPSLTRPFVLHLESVRSLFAPWLVTAQPIEEQLAQIRAYYRELLTGPLCLGIFSHQAGTLAALRDFLDAPSLDTRLFTTAIGLPAPLHSYGQGLPEKPSLSEPALVFVAGEDHDSDFFSSGGHRALLFWQGFLAAGQHGTLRLIGERPDAEALQAAGVDNAFVEQETGRSLFWTSATPAQVEAVMVGSHILLQLADGLCTYTIARAMSLGCVPVIAAVAGSSLLFQDDVHGVAVGREVAAAQPWQLPRRSAQDEVQLVEELLQRVPALLAPARYVELQRAGYQLSAAAFTAEAFAASIWPRVRQLFAEQRSATHTSSTVPSRAVVQCLLHSKGRQRAFASRARPQLRINTGLGSVWSVGGDFVLLNGCPTLTTAEWSVLAPYGATPGHAMVWANSLPELNGRYLPQSESKVAGGSSESVRVISRLLMGFPQLHSRGSHCLRGLRRLRGALAASVAKLIGKLKPAPKSPPGPLRLVLDGPHGCNIVFYDGLFHAVLQRDGRLTPQRMQKGRYTQIFADPDLDKVKQVVMLRRAQVRSAPVRVLSILKGLK